MRRGLTMWAVMATCCAVVVSSNTNEHHIRAEVQKPVRTRTMHADGGIGAPATLQGLWSMSPLVVDAEITKGRPADATLTAPGSSEPAAVFVQTAYELKINEVFKDSSGATKPGKRVELLQIGGDRDKGDYIESVVDPTFQRLGAGERYVLFLKRSRSQEGVFVMATDTADSAFLLAGDATVRKRGRSEVSAEIERYSREDLLNRLRTLAERQR